VCGGGGTAESSPLYKTPTNWAVSAVPRPSSLVREASAKTQNICLFSECPVADAAGGSARARDAPWHAIDRTCPLIFGLGLAVRAALCVLVWKVGRRMSVRQPPRSKSHSSSCVWNLKRRTGIAAVIKMCTQEQSRWLWPTATAISARITAVPERTFFFVGDLPLR
jgi:hypothetical protein